MFENLFLQRCVRAPALAAAALVIAALPASAQNLLTNPSFDSGHDGWQPNDSRIELRDRGDLGSPLAGGSGPGALEVRVLDANGNQMSLTGWSLQPYEQRQVGLPVLGVSSLDGGSVTFRVTSASGSILGYASTVDQASGDAIYNAAR